MKRRTDLLLILVGLLIGATAAFADTRNVVPDEWKCQRECRRELIAGQHTDVGEVIVHRHSEKIVVEYIIDEPGWELKEAHFGCWPSEDDLPPHPAPGQMPWGFENLSGTHFSFEISDDDSCFDDCYYAAHAVVEQSLCPDKLMTKTIYVPNDRYPDFAKVKVAKVGRFGYFNVWLRSDGNLNGDIHSGWCLDGRKPIERGKWYDAEVIYDWEDLGGIVDRPENMDAIEWLTTRGYVGKQIRCGTIVQRQHVQNAIWFLAYGRGVGCVAGALVDEALAAVASKNFVRTCWQRGATFVIQPYNCEVLASPDGVGCSADVQPIFSWNAIKMECPTATPTPTDTYTPTHTHTRTPRPPTKTPTNTRPPTNTPTGTHTPPPTDTPTETPTATRTHTHTKTPTDTPTPTPTPCENRSETAWAEGSYPCELSWCSFFKCCSGEEDD